MMENQIRLDFFIQHFFTQSQKSILRTTFLDEASFSSISKFAIFHPSPDLIMNGP
jgi:hypothetical protein